MRLAPLLMSFVLGAAPATALATPQASPRMAFQEVVYGEIRPSQVQSAFERLGRWIQRRRAARPDLNLILLRELDRPNQFVVLAASREGHSISFEDLGESKQIGLSDYAILPDFNVSSSYLVGSEQLDISPSSLIMVAHLDSDPTQREQTLRLLEKLGALTVGLKGNQGAQVLTWRKRTNHWTLISSWKDLSSYYASLENPDVMRLRAGIASHAAAPSDLRLYRRVE
jgi:quinol monooxygenase YgiN